MKLKLTIFISFFSLLVFGQPKIGDGGGNDQKNIEEIFDELHNPKLEIRRIIYEESRHLNLKEEMGEDSIKVDRTEVKENNSSPAVTKD